MWGHYTDAFGSHKVGGVGGLETAGPGLLWRLRSAGFPFYLFIFFFSPVYIYQTVCLAAAAAAAAAAFRSITIMFNL